MDVGREPLAHVKYHAEEEDAEGNKWYHVKLLDETPQCMTLKETSMFRTEQEAEEDLHVCGTKLLACEREHMHERCIVTNTGTAILETSGKIAPNRRLCELPQHGSR